MFFEGGGEILALRGFEEDCGVLETRERRRGIRTASVIPGCVREAGIVEAVDGGDHGADEGGADGERHRVWVI